MLSALLCGAHPAATPEFDPPLTSTPAPPPLTGDYRVRPKMSTKRTNTAGSLRTLMSKKSRDSFFCSDAQQVELGAIGASDAAAAAAAEAVAKVGGEGSRRWWRTDGSKEGSVKVSEPVSARVWDEDGECSWIRRGLSCVGRLGMSRRLDLGLSWLY